MVAVADAFGAVNTHHHRGYLGRTARRSVDLVGVPIQHTRSRRPSSASFWYAGLSHPTILTEWVGWDCLISAQSACGTGLCPRAPDDVGELTAWLVRATAKCWVHRLELVPVRDLWRDL